jgi:hypothetical protein
VEEDKKRSAESLGGGFVYIPFSVEPGGEIKKFFLSPQ